MFSFGDDRDDTVFDQLRSIRPFTVDQLYLIHPDVGCPPKSAIVSDELDADGDQKFIIPQPDKELYQNLVEYEQLRNQLVKLKHDIKKLYKKTHDHIDKAWTLKEESVRRIAMCQQGKIAETTFKYETASVNKEQLSIFSQEFSGMIDLITKDYIYYSFESQVKRNKISAQLSISYQVPDLETRKTKLRSSIVTLFEFLKYLSDSKPDFVLLCRKWLRALCKRYLDGGTTLDYRFVVSQLAKGPVGTADWSADIIECKPYEQVSGFESVPQYITHCSALLSELFYNIQMRIKHITVTSAATTTDDENISGGESNQPVSDQNWSLVDPRFSCAEELNMASSSCNLLSEADVIKFCLKIPIAQIFRAHVKKCLETTSESHLETDKNYEFVMLKLLTIGTVIIKTYQIGLETFNSIQYGSLIEYLSSQIRRTVVILSDQWTEFKRRLRGIDDALLMRLQVEYDNFMLRSIFIILELRQSGIWRHLSRVERHIELPNNDSQLTWSTESLRPAFAKLLQVTGISAQQRQIPAAIDKASEIVDDGKAPAKLLPKTSSSLTYEFSTEWFKDVSEPMLWHILWQFYHNAFVSSCDYHSDYYWLNKFQEKSVIYLFVNKIKDSPPGECSYLLNSITSMLLSRTKPESKLVNFIATEIFNLTFNKKSVKDKVGHKGVISLIRCAEKFPNLISLYLSLMPDDNDENATELIKSCSLTGWICNETEFAMLESWIIERPLSAPKNKIARLIISKLLLNSPDRRVMADSSPKKDSPKRHSHPLIQRKESRHSLKYDDCFVDLQMRRKLALILYHASTVHLPESNQFGPQSLGASVEVAFGIGLFGSATETKQNQLLELAIDSTYQQFYIWTWRILFALRLHILHQVETDWNNVQIPSGTSRSTKNTALADDPFYPVPSIEDSECQLLADGVSSQSPVAAFIYLFLTDVTWHYDTWPICLTQLNILADSGHITPSLMAMKFFSICHLNDLIDKLAVDKKCLDYFRKVIISNFDATRLASLIMAQLSNLKQYRQLQLSHFYIRVLLDVSTIIEKQISSSWFSNSEISLEKIACILDFIVRFNFTNQRTDLIRKFYISSMVQDQSLQSNGWLGSFLTSNTPQRDFPSTNLHILARKFKKYSWLLWVTTECDTLRLEKTWEDIVAYLSTNEEATLDSAIKKFCPQLNPNLIKSSLPIYSWISQIFNIMESDLNHPLCPLIWYSFFLNYFANSLNGVSVGFKLVSQETLTRLMTRLDSLYNYHLYKQRNWSSSSTVQQNSLTQLYRAYKLWLQDSTLRDAYVDISRLREEYLVPLLKAVMESSNASACLQYVDLDSIESQNRNLIQVWTSSTQSSLSDAHLAEDPIIYVDNNDHEEAPGDPSLNTQDELADDAVSLIVRSHQVNLEARTNKSFDDGEKELSQQLDEDEFSVEKKYRTADELIAIVKQNFAVVFEESSQFSLNISELNRTKTEIIELVLRLYTNKKREFVRVVPCVDGNECVGPARIKFEATETLMDERKSQCIQDRRRQCQELIGELLHMPKNTSVCSTISIEENVRRLIDDPLHSKLVIETLLAWLSEPQNYSQLDGSFYTANYLLKTVLEILSTTTEQVDVYNCSLVDVCLAHPKSVQIFSPYLSPSSCSCQCFLDLYKTICSKQTMLGPMATFVLLSKFDMRSWLSANSTQSKKAYHELINTTCLAFKDIGKAPDQSFELTMDLFRRHLQLELAPAIRDKPDELFLVLSHFLNLMDEQVLAPSLWMDFMIIIGLRHDPKQEDACRMTSITENVARLAECQTIFDHQSLCILVQSISNHIKQVESNGVGLLERYHDYVEQYGVVMLSVTFMWIKSTSDTNLVDRNDLIWRQFCGIWAAWVFPPASSHNKTNYNLVVNCFVFSLHYMFHKIPDCVQSFLGFLLSDLANYVGKLNEDLKIELTVLQLSLKNLPWSSMLVIPSTIENLAFLAELTNYNMSDLVSHIMLQLNTRGSLAHLKRELEHISDSSTLPRIVERIVDIIVAQCHQLIDIQLPEEYLSFVSTSSIPRLASAMLSRSDFRITRSDDVLFRTLRCICIRKNGFNTSIDAVGNQTNKPDKMLTSDCFERAVLYVQFVSNYLVALSKQMANSAQPTSEKSLCKVINKALLDVQPVLQSGNLDMGQKKILYATLMKCCNCDTLDDNTRLLLARLFAESNSMKNKPQMVGDMLQSIGQSLRDPKILVNMIEILVDLYFSITRNFDDAFRQFHISAVQSNHYLDSCIKEKCPMALMIYFELQLGQPLTKYPLDFIETSSNQDANALNIESNGDVKLIWPNYLSWLSRLIHKLGDRSSQGPSNSVSTLKMTTILIRLLVRFEADLEQFLLSDYLLDGDTEPDPSARLNNSMSGENLTLDQEQLGSANSTTTTPSAARHRKRIAKPTVADLSSVHKCLLDFIKQLTLFYDSLNSAGLWSYLISSNKSEQSIKISITSLTVGCFLADRSLMILSEKPRPLPHLEVLHEELVKLRRVALNKLESARRSKYSLDCSQFIDSFIESVQQNSKVQYGEVVQLIATFVRP